MINVNEPLLGGAEDHGIVTAPAVRIGVSQPSCRPHQDATALQQFNNRLIRLEDLLSHVLRKTFGEFPGVSNWAIDFQPVLYACKVILAPMPGRSMDATRPVLGGHVVCEHPQDPSVKKRVLHFEAVQPPSRDSRQDLRGLEARFLHHRIMPSAFDQVHIAAILRRRHVLEFRMKRHGHAGRKRPRRGGPDDNVKLAPCEGGIQTRRVCQHRVAHVN